LAPDKKLMAVALGAGSTFQSATPQPLFQTSVPDRFFPILSVYDAAADGKRFLVITRDRPAERLITVMVDWYSRVKK
jgi:hypothetical protein